MKLKEDSEKAGLKLNIQKTKIMAFSPINSCQIEGGHVETVTDYFLRLQVVIAVMKLKDTCSWKNSYDKPRKQHRHHFANKGLLGAGILLIE